MIDVSRLRVAAVGLAVLLPLAACQTAQTEAAPPETLSGAVTVFAAASMRPTFEELGRRFESEFPATTVTFNFAGSQALATQIVEGAAADVFASANDAQMSVVTDAGLTADEAAVFATNRLTIAVPPDNPADVRALQDLADPSLHLVVCAPTVPCGAATVKVSAVSGTTFTPVSEEQSVTDVLAKVRTGEADVGLVYRTDVIAAGDSVVGIDFPESASAVNRNLIVALAESPNPVAGRAWIDLVLSEDGQRLLADAGFAPGE